VTDRCAAAKFDTRCQLLLGHPAGSPHIAQVKGRNRRTGFAIWVSDGPSSWEADVGAQDWAPTFPRLEP
jgi:hypothetical protein